MPTTKKGGGRKIGRNKRTLSHQLYRSQSRRSKNKAVRVAKSSGKAAALKYAAAHGISDWTSKRLAKLSTPSRHPVWTTTA